tara:strand:- start:1174 stop:1374 length:201 start_codon:yes stop_codon:yes gene_type:complete
MGLDWFWIIWYSMLGLAAVLTWVTEFSGFKFRDKRKSQWQKSKERVSRIYRNYDYSAYNKPYNLRK